MSPIVNAFLRSWPFEPWVLAALLLGAGVYLRGWLGLHRRDPGRWPRGQPLAFGSGLAVLFLALASPIEPFASLVLQVHMLQHVLLTMIASPLLWLGAPMFPLLLGLPRPIRRYWIAPLFHWPLLGRAFAMATHPVSAWLLFTAATWFWHLPPLYELALSSDGWHYLQHSCFFGSALFFWYPVIRPYPSRPRWSPWLLIPYLLLADVQNTLLSAVLTFSDQPLYSSYVKSPRLGNLSPLEDQAAAGVLMWVPGSLAYLVPLFVIGIRLLFGASETSRRRTEPRRARNAGRGADPGGFVLPILGQPRHGVEHASFDILRVPVIGRFLRWRGARLSFQLPMLLLAALVVYDGFFGPPIGPMNLAGVLPWIHWRGLVVWGLLVAGNLFCMACPFMVPRTLARRWLPQGRSWPRCLRSKWLAVVLLVLFLWAYEAFALWDSPWWTAWIVLAYFAAAFVIDGFFRGASFCKYVCPIGQFNFVQSLLSPVEIKVRDPLACVSCQTKDCIRGGDGIPGCELQLYQPRKSSNMDCTFCLDCVHACPHDNVGLLAVRPGSALWHDSFRSSLGRFSKRPDLAALVVVLAFGAFVNAAGMVAPVVEWRDEMASLLRGRSALMVTSLCYVFGLLVVPVVIVWVSAGLCRKLGQLKVSRREVATRFSYALVPIGFSMWLAHYSYHLLASVDAVTPAFQRFACDMGWAVVGDPAWARACCRPVADWLPRLEIVLLDVGLLLSLYGGYRIALSHAEHTSQALKTLAPWALLIVVLFAAGVWIVLQPMQMRGTLTTAG
jgi:cytochrome c oxidase assembly factor CtaG/polyferredoxin